MVHAIRWVCGWGGGGCGVWGVSDRVSPRIRR